MDGRRGTMEGRVEFVWSEGEIFSLEDLLGNNSDILSGSLKRYPQLTYNIKVVTVISNI